ncbi:hypothetical protein [Ruegeria profundi]|nr:hypothetical protein [Ruegeria profundi]
MSEIHAAFSIGRNVLGAVIHLNVANDRSADEDETALAVLALVAFAGH